MISQVRQQLECEAVIVQPSAAPGAAAAAAAAADYSFDQELQITPQLEPHTYSVHGASAADCVLCAVDQKAGLLAALGLSPVLVVVGVHRGPALGSDIDSCAAVAVARQAAQLGLPAVASCLASPSAAASMQPAVDATLQLLQRVVGCLRQARHSSWPAAANMPRAHFPFPEAGRWALGKELPLPQQASSSSSGSTWHPDDCWALGEDNSWAGSSRQPSSSHAAAAADILRRAFADGDILLCLNVPPTWKPSSSSSSSSSSSRGSSAPPVFASTRPGVLWHCYQVEAGPAEPTSSSSSSSRFARQTGTSWRTQEQDVFGRSLPSSSFSSSQPVVTGAFVQQDNTDKVAASLRAEPWQQQQQQQQQEEVPASLVIRRGTLLNDHATAGDVEAVFSSRAAVSTLQAWPVGHPLSLRDAVLAAALDEDDAGLPAWLTP
uniref:Survival protein SurE-like phosphatase/nucleotidase domain-containing protein n=1 Tax=Tetradesmus obliquus TaxID=3088 RepID=A0A383WD67_TETOB|eukprot:jgi/Sobl393_1/215/SZX74954.1